MAVEDAHGETVMLDSYEPRSDGAAGPVSTTGVLLEDEWYEVTASGTLTWWGTNNVCPGWEPLPMYPSPGITNGRVTTDPEMLFSSRSDCALNPRHHTALEFDVGDGFRHVEPESGAPAVPAPDHTYRYVVQGRGVPMQFRLVDRPTYDNWGMFRFDVKRRPTAPDEPPIPFHPPVADAGPDQEVPEGSVVTLDGSASKASTEPALQPSEKVGTLPGGTPLGVSIAGLDPDAEVVRLQGKVDIGQGPPVQNTSLAYVVDVSGSAGFPGGCGGDANRDGRADTVLDCEIAAALKLHEEVVASGTVDKVALIQFAWSASARDLDPTSGVATTIAPDADKDGDGILDFEETLRSLRSGGGTYFLAPTSMACSILAGTGSPHLLTVFLSDGQGSGRFSSVVPCDPPVEFQAFAVGSGSRCDGGGAGSRLADLAALTEGDCTNVPDVSSLPDILPGVLASRITKVEYAIDGGEPVDISAQLQLPVQGPATVDVAVDLPTDLASGTREVCLTVTGEDAGGSASETTCSDLVKVTGEIGYAWRVFSAEGPPVFLSSRTSAAPTFVAPDDGRYEFELTVNDGTGTTAFDRVNVVVGNVAPELEVVPGDAYAGGVTQITGTFTDAGWQDTHRAVVDWGDGTTSEVEVSTSGAGWGTFFASHVYDDAGSFDVATALTDDDGGEDTARLDGFEVQTPVAVWANSSSATDSLDWSGGSGRIEGRVHTNGELRFVGAEKSVRGPTTHAGPLAADTAKNSFMPLPTQTAVQDFPSRPEVADFRPDGAVSRDVGAAYNDMSGNCVDGTWHEVQEPLASGVYYADCDIMLNGSQIGGRVTLVTEGHIKIGGSRPTFEPYYDGLLAVAGAAGDKAIDISASSSKFLGVLFAGSGEISISGASNRFFCGILGDRVDIAGKDVTVRGASCGRPDATVAGPVLVPDLSAKISADQARVLPSDRIAYDIAVTNGGSTLVVPSLVGLENVDSVDATVTGWSFGIERLDAATGDWVPLVGSGDPGLRLDVRSNPYAGVAYPAADKISGTVVPPGGWATWGLHAVVDLEPALVRTLLDPATTSGIRTRVDFTLTPSGVQARRLYTHGHDFVEALRALSGDARNAEVTAMLPDGDALRLLPADVPGLARIGPGEIVAVDRHWDVPVVAPRGEGETDAGYLSRLLALNGTDLNAAVFAVAQGGVGRLVAPLARTSASRSLPVVGVSTVGPAELPAGTSADYAVKLANLGSGTAASLQTAATGDGETLVVMGAPGSLAAGEVGEGTTTYAAPAEATGPVAIRGTATWQDARGNAYGPTGASHEAVRLAPAQLHATLTDALHSDVGGDGSVSPGDVVRYTLTVRNAGGVALTGIDGSVRIDPNAALVAGSGRTPDGGTLTLADGQATFSLPDVAGGSTRTVTFDVTVADPFPDGVSRIAAQGTVGATGLPNQTTDDPALPGATDPTRTTVSQPRPALTAALGGRLVVDADGSGVLSPGDTLAFTLSVSSVGTQDVTGVGVRVPVPAGTSVVDGSVVTTQGSVGTGPGIDVSVGTLAPFQEATVSFRLRVADPLPPEVTSIVVSGTVVSDQLDPLATDDPVTQEVGDASTIPVGDPATNPEKPGPSVSDVGPAEGTVVTAPVHVLATLAPPEGATLTGWSVHYRLSGDSLTTEIASGTGGSVDAVLDPTRMPNGSYVVTVRGTSSNGGTSAAETTVVVDGDAKLGRYQTTITDMTVGVAGLPIQVNRTYDSFDKTQGDYGIGWNVSLANFRVSSNGPLGAGGWTMQGCGSGLIFVPLCFTSSQPHFVTVTWPDGRNEIFDLTPAEGSTFMSGLTSAQFTGRSGTTSTLSAPDNALYFTDGNLNGGFFGSEGVWDPRAFVLTDKSGTKYHLSVGTGLTKVVELSGATTTFGRDGVTSSRGPGVDFQRDAQGRITQVTGPDGETVRYAYDAAGDLVSVADQLGRTTRLSYLPGHYLDRVEGPDGSAMATYEYADGRIVAVIDGAGNRTEISSDPGARQETVTDPGGRRTTISSYDTDGHLVRVNEVYGGADHVTSYAYDEDDNLVLRTDPNGGEWRAAYDDGNITAFTDAGGDTTRVTYGDLGQPLTWTDPAGAVTTYAWNPNGTLASVKDALGHVESYDYDASGLRTSRTDRNGKVWTWTYTAAGLVESETDPLGNVTRYEYDAAGRRTATVDPEGNRTTTAYDAVGNQLSQTDPDGAVQRWVYDDLNRVARTVDPTGAAVDHAYDGAGRLTGVDDHVDAPTAYGYDSMGRQTSAKVGDLPASTTTYDGAGNVATRTDEIGRTTSYAYFADGKLKSETNPAGGVTAYTYTADGQVETRTDPNGMVTRYAYGATGRPDAVTDPAGVTIETRYDEVGRPRFTVFADGTQTEQRYDAAGRLTASVDQQGDTTAYEYDAAGRRTAVVDPEGRRSETEYDAAGRVVGTTGADGAIATSTWSPGGRLLASTSAEGVTTTYGYDAAGRQTRVTDELGHVWSTGYDGLGRVVTERDPRQQGTGPATTTNTYDQYGRMVSTADALGNTVRFGYDAAGQRTSVTDPRGEVWRVDHGPLGNVVEERDPLARARTFAYDDGGRLTSETDPRGVVVDHTYGTDGRLEGLAERGGAGAVGYTYDALGRRATMTDATGTTSWAYFADGAVKSVTAPAGTVSYAYDGSGLRTSMSQPAGTVSYGYDAVGQLASVEDWHGSSTTTDFDSDGRIASLVRPNGVRSEWSYDAAGRLTGLRHLDGTAVVEQASYTLDADGNRTSLRTSAGLESYTLNAVDQLTSVTYPDGTTTGFAYDAAGNRTRSTTGGSATGYAYDAASQLSVVDGVAVGHDAAGNLTKDADGAVYDWDWLSRMTAVTPAEGGRTSYAYDGDGVRVAQTTGGSTDELLHDRYSADGVADLIEAEASAYVHGPGGVLEHDEGGEVSFPLVDALGSVRAVTDASGGVAGRSSYEVFGAVRSSSGTDVGLGFGGAPQDGDLVHLSARDLHTGLGRFLSTDPVRPGAPGAVGWNPYTYVANNPTTWTDPSGRTALTETAVLRPIPIGVLVGATAIGLATLGLIECMATGACLPVPSPPRTRGDSQTDDAAQHFARWERELARNPRLQASASQVARWAVRTCAAVLAGDVLADTPGVGPCGDRPVIFVTEQNHIGTPIQDVTRHIDAAIGSYPRWVEVNKGPNGSYPGWYANSPECEGAGLATGMDCDEYPMMLMSQGGHLATPNPSLRVVDASQNRAAGATFKFFTRSCEPAAQGDRFLVIPVSPGGRLPTTPSAGISGGVLPTFWLGCD